MLQDFEKEKNKFFCYTSHFKDYIIGISKEDKNDSLIISIAINNINNITHQKRFSFKDIYNYDQQFFEAFNNNINILYKFLGRLFLAKLVEVKINLESKDILYIYLICLKDNQIRHIKIDIPSINSSSVNINYYNDIINNINSNQENKNDENNRSCAPVVSSSSKKKNKYKIELSKIEKKNDDSSLYKEIKFEITNNSDTKIKYYQYLNSQEIFIESVPYYDLFNESIDDVFDDLNIIIKNGNYRFEVNNNSIKLFFQVFNIGNQTIQDPYKENFIQANRKERTENELKNKMEEYFSNLNMENESQKEIKIPVNKNNPNDTKQIKENKNKTKIDSETYLLNFLNSKSEKQTNKNTINGALSNNIFNIEETKEKYNKNQNTYINEIKQIKDSENNINKYENNYTIEINDKFIESNSHLNKDFICKKRKIEIEYKDLKIDNFLKPKGNKGENNCKEKSKNEKNNDLLYKKEIKKKSSNNKQKDKKNISNVIQDNCNNFKIEEKKQYNIDKDEVINRYTNILYKHPLDNDDDLKIIKNEKQKSFYICKICNVFFKGHKKAREHQWYMHLKPFGTIIQRDLKKSNQKANNNK